MQKSSTQYGKINSTAYEREYIVWPSAIYSMNARVVQHKNIINIIYHIDRWRENIHGDLNLGRKDIC